MLFERLITVALLKFGVSPGSLPAVALDWSGVRPPGYAGKAALLGNGFGLVNGTKRSHISFTGAIAAAPTVLATKTLSATVTTTYSTGFTQPDVAACIKFVCNQASVGDGTVVGAGAKIVTVVGVDQFGEVVTETVGLNGTGAVSTIRAYTSVTSVTYPTRNASGDTVACTRGLKFALERRLALSTDVVFFSRKLAAGEFATEAVPSTIDAGEWYAKVLANVAGAANSAPAAFSVTFDNVLWPISLPSTPFILQVIAGSRVENCHCTASSASGATTTLTIVRGVHGTTDATLPPIPKGAWLNWRSGFTYTTTVTAADKLQVGYLSAMV